MRTYALAIVAPWRPCVEDAVVEKNLVGDTPEKPVCMADETVSGEPVSGSKFPASREFAGNFSEFEPDQAKGVWLMR
jgi:hypothetical protein